MTPGLKDHIAKTLSLHTPLTCTPVSGGSINQAWQITSGDKKFFCKVNSTTRFPELFAKEAAGLEALAATGGIQCPEVLNVATLNDEQIILMEWIAPGSRNSDFWTLFGEQLAKLHLWRHPGKPETRFGFYHDNYMGSLPQSNDFMDDWCDFFRDQRLKPQVSMANSRKLLPASAMHAFDSLYKKLPDIFPSSPACLIHGDLWSGNFLCSHTQQPVLIDPAVYYGHPGMDMAMTTLFGGFHHLFYEAYDHWMPSQGNNDGHLDVCNLYPLLIHLNLFGSSYLPSIESCLRRFR